MAAYGASDSSVGIVDARVLSVRHIELNVDAVQGSFLLNPSCLPHSRY